MLYKVKEFGCDIARKLLSNRAKALVQELYLRRVRRQAAGLHSRQESLWQAIREKAVINVVFEMYHLGFWRSESLFRLMQGHPRFNPVIWVVPHYDCWNNAANAQASIQYCRAQNFPYVTHHALSG